MLNQKKVEIFSRKFRKSLAKQFLEVALKLPWFWVKVWRFFAWKAVLIEKKTIIRFSKNDRSVVYGPNNRF